MNQSDKWKVLRGEVFFEGRWVPIERKIDAENRRRKKIEAGYVFYHGEWITIEEKYARVVPGKPSAKQPETIVVNINDNRTFYTIDNRTLHEHQHRHLSLDKETLDNYMSGPIADTGDGTAQLPDGNQDGAAALPDPKKHRLIKNKRKIKGLLRSPDDK